MNDNVEQFASSEDTIESFIKAMETGSLAQLHQQLNEFHPAEIADILETLPSDMRISVWELVSPDINGDVLLHLNDNLRASLINDMAPQELVAAVEGLDTDDLADLIPEMPDDVTAKVISGLDEQNRQRLESALAYPEDSAGGLMNMDMIQIRADINVEVVLRYLRLLQTLPATTDSLFVVDRDNRYIGTLPLTILLTSEAGSVVENIMSTELEGIHAQTPALDVAKRFELRDLVSAPVVDENGTLLGRITIDDVVDVIREDAEHSFMGMAGLNEEEDLFAPVISSTRRRTIWLGVNMLTAILASWVIGLFDATIEKLVALAILMPIVASMGGIAGNQTLALVIRGMALGQISRRNARTFVRKELMVGFLNGIFWALVIALASYLWFGDMQLGIIIASAIFINLVFAALSGALVPLALRKMGIDPVLAGSVVLTTITDVIGFLAFLGLATLFLF